MFTYLVGISEIDGFFRLRHVSADADPERNVNSFATGAQQSLFQTWKFKIRKLELGSFFGIDVANMYPTK